jgi:hypothetical protein
MCRIGFHHVPTVEIASGWCSIRIAGIGAPGEPAPQLWDCYGDKRGNRRRAGNGSGAIAYSSARGSDVVLGMEAGRVRAPMPPDEEKRLEILRQYKILDTAAGCPAEF